MNEAQKILPVVMHLLKGKAVLDLGCGDQKIVPWALGVDSGKEWAKPPEGVDIFAYVDPGARELAQTLAADGKPATYDVVFSSHTLEHMRAPILETLEYWVTFVSPGGVLVLYLPDERYYVYDRKNPRARNPAHKHLLTLDTFMWYVEQLQGITIDQYSLDVVENDFERYSFLVVLRKA